VPTLVTQLRRVLAGVRREVLASPERRMLRRLEQEFHRKPRYTRGAIAVGPYDIEYADAGSVWPQWDDMFMRGTLEFTAGDAAPRILDCGANVGIASLYFKRRYPLARITAFEADPNLAAMCRRNLQANGASDVDVQASAVWIENGRIEFIAEGSDSGVIAAVEPSVTGQRIAVPAVRLRDFLREPIDLLKLDIEGAELAVLQDCRNVLDQVRNMTIDLHEFDPAHRQTGDVFGLLTDAGFTFDVKSLVSLPWRTPDVRSPFPKPAPVWAVQVRAWRS
jgi:FkbM family methyltransferase